jgi:hypothetical protein
MTNPAVQNKPTTAFALSLVGGVFEIIAAVALFFVAAIFGAMRPTSYTSGFYTYTVADMRGFAWIFGAIGAWLLIAAIIIIISAVKLNGSPLEHSKWGVLILVFSIVGGINIFGIIGGALALSYKPQLVESAHLYSSQGYTRYCQYCGSALDPNSRFCASCGKQVS